MAKEKVHPSRLIFDFFCAVSVIGIWPRFIEPQIIKTTTLTLSLPQLPEEMEHLTLLQLSDLHFHSGVSERFLDHIMKKTEQLQPDLIVFTGDFLCYSRLEEPDRLHRFLNRFSAPYGCFAILGNHDYEKRVSVNDQGDYDIVDEPSSLIGTGIKRLFFRSPLTSTAAPRAHQINPNPQLIELIRNTPFTLLDNQTEVIPIFGSAFNVCGVGEHMVGQCQPETAFRGWDSRYPGVILAHNPDCIPKLATYPGDLILCGHTHGSQINIPWFREAFTLLENPTYKRGVVQVGEKFAYINRGIGSTVQLRFCSFPELLLITWKRGEHEQLS